MKYTRKVYELAYANERGWLNADLPTADYDKERRSLWAKNSFAYDMAEATWRESNAVFTGHAGRRFRFATVWFPSQAGHKPYLRGLEFLQDAEARVAYEIDWTVPGYGDLIELVRSFSEWRYD